MFDFVVVNWHVLTFTLQVGKEVVANEFTREGFMVASHENEFHASGSTRLDLN